VLITPPPLFKLTGDTGRPASSVMRTGALFADTQASPHCIRATMAGSNARPLSVS
jgi:hypothetical protein